MVIYFTLLFVVSFVPFWNPEAAWGAHFLVTVVIIEFLSGALFPIDVLPVSFQNVLFFTPFPYLIFFPLQVYLGNIVGPALFKGLLISGFWVIVLWLFMKFVWNKGLKVFQAYGR